MLSVRRGLLPLRRLFSTTPSPCAGVASPSPPAFAPPTAASSADPAPDGPPAAATSADSGAADGAAEPPARRPRRHCRPKNLFEVAAYLPNDGLAGTFIRNAWTRAGYTGCYWTVTRVERPTAAGKLPKYYGILTWKGVAGQETRVRPAFKRGWRFVREEREGGGGGEVAKGGDGEGGGGGGAPGVLHRSDAG